MSNVGEQQTLFSSDAYDGQRSLSSGSIADAFSSFARHLTPSYRHDRIERSIQMRLYSLYKGQFVLIFIMFLCLFLIALLMGMAGPTIITEHTETAKGLESNDTHVDLVKGPFVILTPPLHLYRRELWLQATLVRSTTSESFHKEIEVCVGVQSATSATSREIVGEKLFNTRRRRLSCDSSSAECDAFIVVHLARLQSNYYLLNVTLKGLESVDAHYGISDWKLNVVTYNPEFTALEVGFRCLFVVVSVIAGIAFALCMHNFPIEDWTMEQSHSVWPGVLEALFQTAFLCSLLLFWLCVQHGLRQTDRTLINFYAPKLAIVGSMFVAAAMMAVTQEINELHDPSYSYQINTAHFAKFQLYFVCLLSVYCVWLLYLSLRAFGELRFLNHLDARLKFHLSSMLIVLVLTLSLIWSRFGSAVLEDNFVARIYTSYESQSHFLAFYTVLNCYVYLMVYVYTPSGNSKGSGVMKDNPSVSMLNESDIDEDEENFHLDDHECTPLTNRSNHRMADIDDSD